LDKLQEAGEIIGSALYDVLRVNTPNLTNSKTRSQEDLSAFYNRGEVE